MARQTGRVFDLGSSRGPARLARNEVYIEIYTVLTNGEVYPLNTPRNLATNSDVLVCMSLLLYGQFIVLST